MSVVFALRRLVDSAEDRAAAARGRLHAQLGIGSLVGVSGVSMLLSAAALSYPSNLAPPETTITPPPGWLWVLGGALVAVGVAAVAWALVVSQRPSSEDRDEIGTPAGWRVGLGLAVVLPSFVVTIWSPESQYRFLAPMLAVTVVVFTAGLYAVVRRGAGGR